MSRFSKKLRRKSQAREAKDEHKQNRVRVAKMIMLTRERLRLERELEIIQTQKIANGHWSICWLYRLKHKLGKHILEASKQVKYAQNEQA